MDPTKVTYRVEDETPERLREIAEQYGIVNARGPRAGEGNVNALLDAIAEGQYWIVINPKGNGKKPQVS